MGSSRSPAAQILTFLYFYITLDAQNNHFRRTLFIQPQQPENPQTIKAILQKTNYQKTVCGVDAKKAFDCVDH